MLRHGVTDNNDFSPPQRAALALLQSRRMLLNAETFAQTSWIDGALALEWEGPHSVDVRDFTISDISVSGVGEVAEVVKGLVPALRRQRRQAAGVGKKLVVACADWPNFPHLKTENKNAQEHDGLVTFVYLNGNTAICGPFVIPSHSSCLECYLSRFGAGMKEPSNLDVFVSAVGGDVGGVTGIGRHVNSATYSPLPFIAHRHLFGIVSRSYRTGAPGRVDEFEPVACELVTRQVVRVSECTACGRPSRRLRDAAVRDMI